ncbi:MAG: RIO1 family regulatory kinase/ATPase [Nitrososphaerota archaeon]
MKEIASFVAEMTDDHVMILRTIEDFMRSKYIVSIEQIARKTNKSREYISKLIDELHSKHLIWAPKGREKGFTLNFNGLDTLALIALSRRGILSFIGSKIGIGKEAEIYVGMTSEKNVVAVKFYRIGSPSMKKYVRFRDEVITHPSYLEASKRTAAKEIEALKILSLNNVPSPQPISRNRHVIVTSLIEGDPLPKIKKLERPVRIFESIINSIEMALEAGVIHCDLSAYNVLLKNNDEIVIIDWPQWVRPTHRMAERYLVRDLSNIIDFFVKRHHLIINRDKYFEVLTNKLREYRKR